MTNGFSKVVDIIYNEFENFEHISIEKPKGGYFVWVKLSESVNIDKLKKEFKGNDIAVTYGDIFVRENERNKPEFDYLKRRFRMAISYLEDDVVLEGCKLIKQCVKQSLFD